MLSLFLYIIRTYVRFYYSTFSQKVKEFLKKEFISNPPSVVPWGKANPPFMVPGTTKGGFALDIK
jgi:hypothetical protein